MLCRALLAGELESQRAKKKPAIESKQDETTQVAAAKPSAGKEACPMPATEAANPKTPKQLFWTTGQAKHSTPETSTAPSTKNNVRIKT